MRWLAGTFDVGARASSSRVRAALAPGQSWLVEAGPLRVAYTGELACSGETLCLLDGHLDNGAALAAEVGAPAGITSEALIAVCWRRWRHRLVERLRGDFVLLIWDRELGEGLLARDQLGVRSLFVRETGGVLCFANEIKYLLALSPQSPAPDLVGVAHWITATGRPGPGTLYIGVRRLGPGDLLLLGPNGVRERPYWRPRFEEPRDISPDELAHNVRDAIALAVRRRTIPGQTTGVLMSGGLDSATVAATARAVTPGRVVACSGVFPDHPGVDESRLIEQLCVSLDIDLLTAEVRAGGLVASALEAQSEWGAPLVGWGEFWALPLLREAASAGVQIVLGGDGGDELFQVHSYLAADRMRAGHPLEALRLVRRLPGAGDRPPLHEVGRVAWNLAILGALPARLQTYLARRDRDVARPPWLRSHAVALLRESEDAFAWKRLDGPRWWAHSVHMLTRGVEELGVFESLRRTAMLVGVDMRHPLFDLDLLAVVLRAPPASSFDPLLDRPLLRASMAGLLPDEVRLRRGKALFDSLIVDSLRRDRSAIRAVLCDPQAELSSLVDLDLASRTLLANQSRPQSFLSAQFVWRLLTAELWLRSQGGTTARGLPRGLSVSEPSVLIRGASERARRAALR